MDMENAGNERREIPETAWFATSSLAAPAALRLFCLPHAGGGAAIYHRWTRSFPSAIGVIPVRLPGRESRLQEPAREVMHALVEELANELLPWTADTPYALFGHSMGAAIAFEVARRLSLPGGTPPVYLFVSSCRAPRAVRPAEQLHRLPTEPMIERLLERYGSSTSTSSEERSLMELLAPTLRADLKLLEQYTYVPGPLLSCPIAAVGGASDGEVARQDLEAWRHESAGGFAMRIFPGGHFYLRDQEALLTQYLAQRLRPYLPSDSASGTQPSP